VKSLVAEGVADTQMYTQETLQNKGMYENVLNCEDDNTLVIDNESPLDIDRIQEHEVGYSHCRRFFLFKRNA